MSPEPLDEASMSRLGGGREGPSVADALRGDGRSARELAVKVFLTSHINGDLGITPDVLDKILPSAVIPEAQIPSWDTYFESGQPGFKHYWVAKGPDNKVVAFCQASRHDPTRPHIQNGILNIFVDDSMQGLGIGMDMYRKAMDWIMLSIRSKMAEDGNLPEEERTIYFESVTYNRVFTAEKMATMGWSLYKTTEYKPNLLESPNALDALPTNYFKMVVQYPESQ